MTEELREEILEILRDYFNDYYFEERMMAKQFFDEIKDYTSALDYVKKRLIDIENMIHHHAIGVQNVYTEILKIKEIYNLTLVDKELFAKIEKIKQLNDILN